eukprot:4846214-Prymnesium_polylepis.1
MWLGQRSGRLGASAQATRQSGNVNGTDSIPHLYRWGTDEWNPVDQGAARARPNGPFTNRRPSRHG